MLQSIAEVNNSDVANRNQAERPPRLASPPMGTQMSNEQIEEHKEKFNLWVTNKYLNPALGKVVTTNAVRKERGEKYLSILLKREKGTVRERERIKNRHFCVHIDGNNQRVLGVEITNKKTQAKITKQVAFIEDFYDILFYIHNKLVNHSGENKTEYQVDLRYACFPETAINEYIKHCPLCSIKRTGSAAPSRLEPIFSHSFWERLQLDLIDMRYKAEIYKDGLLYSYIAHAIDCFSGFNILWAQVKKDADEVARNCEIKLFAIFGLPQVFHTDNGTKFKEQLVTALIKRWPGVCKVVCSRPRGKSEQSYGSLERLLTAQMLELNTDKWVDLLPRIQFIMNTRTQNDCNSTPYYIAFGKNPNIGFSEGGNVEKKVATLPSPVVSDIPTTSRPSIENHCNNLSGKRLNDNNSNNSYNNEENNIYNDDDHLDLWSYNNKMMRM